MGGIVKLEILCNGHHGIGQHFGRPRQGHVHAQCGDHHQHGNNAEKDQNQRDLRGSLRSCKVVTHRRDKNSKKGRSVVGVGVESNRQNSVFSIQRGDNIVERLNVPIPKERIHRDSKTIQNERHGLIDQCIVDLCNQKRASSVSNF